MVDGLLHALGPVRVGGDRARLPGRQALLHPGRLGQGVVVEPHVVDDDPPPAAGVGGAQRADVGGGGAADVGLLLQVLQVLHRVLRLHEGVLVDLPDQVVVLEQRLLYLVLRVLVVVHAEGGVALGALGRAVVRVVRVVLLVLLPMYRKRIGWTYPAH